MLKTVLNDKADPHRFNFLKTVKMFLTFNFYGNYSYSHLK